MNIESFDQVQEKYLKAWREIYGPLGKEDYVRHLIIIPKQRDLYRRRRLFLFKGLDTATLIERYRSQRIVMSMSVYDPKSKGQEHFDLHPEKMICQHARNPNFGSYQVDVDHMIEPDHKLDGMSAKEFGEKVCHGKPWGGATINEELLYGLWSYYLNGDLSVVREVECPGSRSQEGLVPTVKYAVCKKGSVSANLRSIHISFRPDNVGVERVAPRRVYNPEYLRVGNSMAGNVTQVTPMRPVQPAELITAA